MHVKVFYISYIVLEFVISFYSYPYILHILSGHLKDLFWGFVPRMVFQSISVVFLELHNTVFQVEKCVLQELLLLLLIKSLSESFVSQQLYYVHSQNSDLVDERRLVSTISVSYFSTTIISECYIIG